MEREERPALYLASLTEDELFKVITSVKGHATSLHNLKKYAQGDAYWEVANKLERIYREQSE